ncbi:MAG: hypothetical protein ACOYOJ_22925, partial [Alsobacter sp.]
MPRVVLRGLGDHHSHRRQQARQRAGVATARTLAGLDVVVDDRGVSTGVRHLDGRDLENPA